MENIFFPLETVCCGKILDIVDYNYLVPSARAPEAIYRVFGRRLRELREIRKLPQEELATLSGLTRASVANIESGRQRVLLHQVLKFAQALRVDLNTLVANVSGSPESVASDASISRHDYLERLRGVAEARSEESNPK